MPTFRTKEDLYEVLDALFHKLSDHPEIAEPLLAADFVLRFRFSEPDAQATITLRRPRLEWKFGQSDVSPELELIQSGDTAHEFWQGRLNVPLALASRKVVSRGSIAKALALLPVVKPAFPLYRETMRELGHADLLASASRGRSGTAGPIRNWLDEHLPIRLPAKLEMGALVAHLRRRRKPTELPRPERAPIPLIDQDSEATPKFREVRLPSDDAELRREMLRRMLLIRAFEEKLSELYADGRVPTEAIHLSIGQEASAVGACFALRGNDYMATTHRGHGHMLAKGADPRAMMAEIMGKASGLCGGKGGSMHVTDAAIGAIGANGIVGASPLIAVGAGHSIALRKSDQVAVAFFGDGASNQGMFHEAMNFAAVFDLPVVFVLENNQYGEFTAVRKHTRVGNLADRAIAYNMPAHTVDGNDCPAVYRTMKEAVARARGGQGPSLVVCDTYRWHGHMEGETADYRPADEIRAWKEKCPIGRLRSQLEADGELSASSASELESAASREIEEALEAALAAAEPPLSALTESIYAPEPRRLYTESPSSSPTGPEQSYSEAVRSALREEMRRDERVYLLGEDVSAGGYFNVTSGLIDEFGPTRVIDTPISEYAIVGSAVGAAMTGARPVAEILFSDFLTTCMDPLVNNAAKLRYMSGGQYQIPMVVRTPGGAGLGMAAQHSQSLEALLAGIPGLILLAPASPRDAKGLLKAAIRSNNPVVVFENKLLYASTGPVPQDDDFIVPIGVADCKRPGRDVTVVAVGGALLPAMAAAESLAEGGIDVELIDPRTVVPLDTAAILRSVQKTGRLVTIEEAPRCHGFGAEIIARVCEHGFHLLAAPPRRIAAEEVPIPYNRNLERAAVPSIERIERAVRDLVG